MRIGIPSALFYYVYFPMWKVFFEELGVQVITTGKTTRRMLDSGVREALADACVPIKVFFGHALALKGKVDFLFIPRIVCLNKKTVYCPKFLGLPDMIRHGLADMPPVIDVRIDNRDRKNGIFSAYYAVGKMLNASPLNIIRAYLKARLTQLKFQRVLNSGLQPLEAMDVIFKGKKYQSVKQPGQLTFALVGYPYAIHDPYISVGVVEKLRQMSVQVLTPDNVPPGKLNWQKHGSGKRMFWTFSERTLRAAAYFARRSGVDGIIHLTAFGCGPDSIVDRFIRFNNKNGGNIPFMSLTIDEHSGEAGIGTRLEAFVDMVKRKKRGDR
ncbi:acyl-CoA dehydratase activase-related protein [Desulfoscipio geothermicus]|uniref:Predicted nucleotide-binding protein, sugar kinase/HSP70/actin superfamily n=1 Tax=Desulfoscipio geothermicus DSM 3669 TaxID=1121426 RepID=A0A1I6D9M5_9FIRM|nr:acyl-CoA dehydratase activase-related protein [Desulfoscipio geothermicus]SFR02067.1 Predicted nucleotide-binding protein, sugar kinase/HSP70/actin superfamily [Desulfoscipio geothermicus DSM 3669]